MFIVVYTIDMKVEITVSHHFNPNLEPVPYVHFSDTWGTFISQSVLRAIVAMFEKDVPVVRPFPDTRFFFRSDKEFIASTVNQEEVSNLLSNLDSSLQSSSSPYTNREILEAIRDDGVFAAMHTSLQRMEHTIFSQLSMATNIDDVASLFAHYSYYEFAIEKAFQAYSSIQVSAGDHSFYKAGVGYAILGSEMNNMSGMIHAKAAEIIEQSATKLPYSSDYHHWNALRAFQLSLALEIGAPENRKRFILSKMLPHFNALGITKYSDR